MLFSIVLASEVFVYNKSLDAKKANKYSIYCSVLFCNLHTVSACTHVTQFFRAWLLLSVSDPQDPLYSCTLTFCSDQSLYPVSGLYIPLLCVWSPGSTVSVYFDPMVPINRCILYLVFSVSSGQYPLYSDLLPLYTSVFGLLVVFCYVSHWQKLYRQQ